MKILKKTLLILGMIIFSSSFCLAQDKNIFQDKFVIIIDIQKEYTENSMPDSLSQKLIDSINYVIDHVNANNVIYLQSFHKLLNIATTRPFIYVSIDTSAKYDLDSRMKLVNENIIKKEKSNAFNNNDLNCFLHQNNAKEIIVIGLMAEQCVFETLLGGKELGYKMYVIPEAIIGKSGRSKRKMIRYFKKKKINILRIR